VFVRIVGPKAAGSGVEILLRATGRAFRQPVEARRRMDLRRGRAAASEGLSECLMSPVGGGQFGESKGSREGEGSRRAANGHADMDLMRRVASNDESAIAELYDRFGSLVFRMAYQSMPSRSEADDAVQEVFIRLWRTASRYDDSRSALVTWVMLISRRHLVDKLRRNKARLRTTSLDQPAAAAAEGRVNEAPRLDVQEKMKVLMQRIDQLPELQKTVVTRAYLGGQTLRQIGEELDTPLGTVKSALSRALVRLRERSGEELAI
jgi:RNA polymerase sigma-70 factor (ECF subfamily)